MLEVEARLAIVQYTAYLAAAQLREGAIIDALETVEQALQVNPDELVSRPETLRLRAELWLKQGHTAKAASGFRDAIEVARSMSAKAWELRAAISLARLLAKQVRRDEARATLAEISWLVHRGLRHR